jgi:hypothetical protein
MKRRVVEKTESEEAEEETFRRAVKTRARSVIGRELAPRIEEQQPKPQVTEIKRHIVFNIPIKGVKQLKIPQPQPPYLKIKLRSFVGPKLLSIQISPTTLIIPTISMAPRAMALKDVRVSILTPNTIHELVTPPLRLKLKPLSDISVRPIIRSEPSKGMGVLTPLIKPARVVFQRPSVVFNLLERSSTVYVPRMQLTPSIEEYQPIMQASKPEVKVGATEIAEPEEPFEGEIESLFELFLEEKSGKGIGGALSYSGEPVYIVLAKPYDDEYKCVDALHYFCIRALREYGILPDTRALSSGYGRAEIERYLGEREITIITEGALSKELVVKLEKRGSEAPQLELVLKELNEDALADRMKDIGKGLQYVIFHVEQHLAGLLYDKLWKLRSKFHDKIFWIEPKALSTELRRELAKLMWSFVDVPNMGSYDQLLGFGKTTYYNKLESIGREVERKLERPYPIPRANPQGPESEEHLLLKEFLAKCLVDKPPEELLLSKIAREERYKHIEFEKEWRIGDNIAISDAYVESDGIAIEVETLFEEGKRGGKPLVKIRDETVEKYRRIPINELWILMENITMLRHLRELWGLRTLYRRWYEKGELSFQVKFFALDLKDEKLVSMEELAGYLHKILRELIP